MKKFATAFLVLALAAPMAFAEGQGSSEAYYQVSKVSVTEEVPTATEIAATYLDLERLGAKDFNNVQSLESLELDWDTLKLIGEKLVEIIKMGEAVVDIKRDAVAVVPGGLQSWQQLAGWQAPMTKVYRYTVSNLLGMDVVDFRLKVSGMWGGNYNGRGQYLANVLVVPTDLNVRWGWELHVWSENRDPVNTGSTESPIAGLGFDIRYVIKTFLNEKNGTQDYFVTGDGKIQAL